MRAFVLLVDFNFWDSPFGSSMSKRETSWEDSPPGKKPKTERKSKKRSCSSIDLDDAGKKSKKNNSTDYVQSASLSAIPQSEIDLFLKSNVIEVSDPSLKTPLLRPLISFDHLPACNGDLYRPLQEFPAPTPVQAAAWPLLFAGRDVIGIAETGSGKTLAFGLPCLKKVMELKSKGKSSHPKAVILTPTRELAMQVHEQLKRFASLVNIEAACVFGGVKKDEQRELLKTASIVVATPGRLKDLVGEGSVSLGKIRYLVLDEADRMLDKGFEQDIKDIISHMPVSRRQTAMFTATWPPAVRSLAENFTNSPATITVGGEASADPRANTRIRQVIEVLSPRDKENRLLQVLEQLQRNAVGQEKVLVFCLYKKEATRIERLIGSKGYKVASIHGDLNQNERIRSLQAFKSGSVDILVATDVAARGLDIPAVKTVLNVTFPLTIEDYVHRIGR
jgi:ATP-dependent RNA helicase DBP3